MACKIVALHLDRQFCEVMAADRAFPWKPDVLAVKPQKDLSSVTGDTLLNGFWDLLFPCSVHACTPSTCKTNVIRLIQF